LQNDHSQRPDLPKGEVEIIPPGEERPRSGGFIYTNSNGSVRVVKLGPVGASLAGLGVLALLMLCFLFLGGALLLFLPIAGLLTLGAVVSGLIGNPFKKLR
jgi:hypothetical protein